MKSKLKVLALSAAVLAGFAAAPAHAYVYADSRLLINSLNIGVTQGGNPAPFAVTSFTFTTTNTATLNNAPAITTANCQGSFNGATYVPSATNPCGSAPVVNAGPANAPGGSAGATRGNLDYGFKGPSGGFQFSNSASSIDSSELFGPTTKTSQIAESELQTGTSASATALIQSITGFTFNFSLAAPGALTLNFSADPDQYAAISELFNGAFAAQSSMSTSFTLQQLSGGNQRAVWAPSGTTANDCTTRDSTGTLTCVETNDSRDLNATIGTNTNNTVADLNQTTGLSGFGLFGINITGLLAGNYSLTLAASTSTQLARQVIPEPGTVALLGIGLAALALRGRHKAKTQF